MFMELLCGDLFCQLDRSWFEGSPLSLNETSVNFQMLMNLEASLCALHCPLPEAMLQFQRHIDE